jgi:hypothetical protein
MAQFYTDFEDTAFAVAPTYFTQTWDTTREWVVVDETAVAGPVSQTGKHYRIQDRTSDIVINQGAYLNELPAAQDMEIYLGMEIRPYTASDWRAGLCARMSVGSDGSKSAYVVQIIQDAGVRSIRCSRWTNNAFEILGLFSEDVAETEIWRMYCQVTGDNPVMIRAKLAKGRESFPRDWKFEIADASASRLLAGRAGLHAANATTSSTFNAYVDFFSVGTDGDPALYAPIERLAARPAYFIVAPPAATAPGVPTSLLNQNLAATSFRSAWTAPL